MKNLFLFLVFATAFCKNISAQSVMKTDYKQVIKVNSKIKPADIYTAAQNWFSGNTNLFTAKNAETPATGIAKNKQEVEDAYDNKRPLQSLDPSANRVLGQGLIKYFGGTTTSIQLLYIKYDITIEAKAGQVTNELRNKKMLLSTPAKPISQKNTKAKLSLIKSSGAR
jgi:hypothetical protein